MVVGRGQSQYHRLFGVEDIGMLAETGDAVSLDGVERDGALSLRTTAQGRKHLSGREVQIFMARFIRAGVGIKVTCALGRTRQGRGKVVGPRIGFGDLFFLGFIATLQTLAT